MVFSVQEFLEQLVHLILTERVLEQRGSSVSKGSSGKGGRGSRVVIASSSSSKGDRSSVKGGRVASSSSSNVLLRKVVVGLQVPNESGILFVQNPCQSQLHLQIFIERFRLTFGTLADKIFRSVPLPTIGTRCWVRIDRAAVVVSGSTIVAASLTITVNF